LTFEFSNNSIACNKFRPGNTGQLHISPQYTMSGKISHFTMTLKVVQEFLANLVYAALAVNALPRGLKTIQFM